MKRQAWYDRIAQMKKAIKLLLFGLMTVFAIVIVAAPFVLPAAVEYYLAGKLSELGFRPKVKMKFGYCWRNGPGVAGSLAVSIVGTPWVIRTEFGASCSEWALRVKMPETVFDASDPVLAKLLERHPVPDIEALDFSGSIAVDASAERTFHKPVPSWSVKIPLKNLSAHAVLAGDGDEPSELSLRGLFVTAGASGLADHYDIAPIFPRAASLTFNGLSLTNFSASVRATERALMVNSASVGFCGGTLNVYSLFLDPQTFNAGFTLFLDNVDAGQLLKNLKGFRGAASGRLHGKVKLFVKEGGKAIRLNDAFVYSTSTLR